MYLTNAYFQGLIYLPNLAIDRPSQVGIGQALVTVAESSLDYFIQEYEREFLIKLLGIRLYDAFVAGMSGQDDKGKWEALRDEIFHVGDPFPTSPAANYVYFQLVRNGITTTTMKGEVAPEQDYAKTSSPGNKLVMAWNAMVSMVGPIRKFILDNEQDYGEWVEPSCWHEFHIINRFGI